MNNKPKVKINIGKVALPGNTVLSPMAGVTDAPFREIARQNGADYTISEMLTSQLSLWDTSKTKLRLNDRWGKTLKILQIAGASPEVVVEAAIKCEEIGADILEINMGCPAKKVCNVLAGSALLKDEQLVQTILSEVTKAVSIPVTLKTRLGWDDTLKNIVTVAKIAEDANIQGLTIHGRTRNDLYNGTASYDLIATVKQNLSIPVFANGDIDTPQKAKYVLDYTKADGLYIGRAALGRPWLFQQIKDYLATGVYVESPTQVTIKNTILQHIQYIHTHYPAPLRYRFATKHVKWYCQHLAFDLGSYKNMFTKFSISQSEQEQLDLVENLLQYAP